VIRSVLFEYTRNSPDACIDEKIVFKEYSVERAGGMVHVSDFKRRERGNARDRRDRPRNGAAVQVKAA
jgi:mannose-1-phosphate guanylyltransferase